MKFGVFESRMIFGPTIVELMEGVEAMKKDGWEPFGTPYPCNLPGARGYGMMHLVVRDRAKD